MEPSDEPTCKAVDDYSCDVRGVAIPCGNALPCENHDEHNFPRPAATTCGRNARFAIQHDKDCPIWLAREKKITDNASRDNAEREELARIISDAVPFLVRRSVDRIVLALLEPREKPQPDHAALIAELRRAARGLDGTSSLYAQAADALEAAEQVLGPIRKDLAFHRALAKECRDHGVGEYAKGRAYGIEGLADDIERRLRAGAPAERPHHG